MINNIISKYSMGLGAALLLLGFTSCNDDILSGDQSREGAGEAMPSVAAVSDATLHTWTAGDIIGVSTSYYDLSSQNRQYICGADGKFTNVQGDPIYVKGTCNLLAYYPFFGTDSEEPVFEISTLNQDETSLPDYLFAKVEDVTPATAGTTQFQFKRALGDLVINITSSDDVINSFTMTGTYTNGVVDPYSLDINLGTSETMAGTVDANNQKISLRMLPQGVSTQVNTVKLKINGTKTSYGFNLNDSSQDFIINAGGTTTYNIDTAEGITSVTFTTGGKTTTVDWKQGTSEDISSDN